MQRYRCLWLLALGIAALHLLQAPLAAEDVPQSVPDEVHALIQAHCVACHGERKVEADLRLDTFASQGWNDYELLDEITQRVEGGEMPPDDAEKPLSTTDKTALLASLTSRLELLETKQLVGSYKKLTAQEYSNTLADLFGRPVDERTKLPFDSDNDFKKLGEHQVVTSYAVKEYYDAAQRYLDDLILHEPIQIKTTTLSPQNPKQWVPQRYSYPIGAVAGRGNPPNFMLRNPVRHVVEEGEYELVFDWQAIYVPTAEAKRPDLENIGKYKSAKALQPPQIRVNVSGGELLNPIDDEKNSNTGSMDGPLCITLDKDAKFIDLFGPLNNYRKTDGDDPRYAEIEKSNLSSDEKRAARKALGEKINQELHGDNTMFLWVRSATLRGPINKDAPPAHTLIFGDAKRDAPIETCDTIVRRWAERLFRRPVSSESVDEYVALARAEYESSRNAYLAVKVALNAMLCSPHFVFKYEGSTAELDDYMIAARLSYFLWNSTPDEELLDLAAAGKLREPQVRTEQALRLLANREKSERFTRDFSSQWLGLHKFGAFSPNEAYIDVEKFARLKPSIAAEPQEFVNEVLYNNLSALNFIDSDFVVWNRDLKGIYGSRDLKLDLDRDADLQDFQRMDLLENPGRARGGLMTMASIMSLTTDGENTQPILRGVWVARHLLGMEIEPPATVPALEVNLQNVDKPREILALHKSDQSCYACHVKFDHLGLALENYDVLGRWQTNYVHPVLNEKNRFELVTKDVVDSLAETPEGEKLPGVEGLKAHLMKNQETVMRNLVVKLFGYAWGREVRYKDRLQIDAIIQTAKKNEYKLQDLILDMITCESFIQR